MDWPGFARRLLLADGRISEAETAMLRRAMLADKTVSRDEVGFLISLKREAVSVHPDFDEFLFKLLTVVVLSDGIVSDEEALWLREVLLTHGEATEAEREFVERLKHEADKVGHEFKRLYKDVMKLGAGDSWG